MEMPGAVTAAQQPGGLSLVSMTARGGRPAGLAERSWVLIVVTVDELRAVKDAAVACAWGPHYFRFNLSMYWSLDGRPCPQGDEGALDAFRRKAVPMCRDLHNIWGRLSSQLSPEVRDVILSGAARAKLSRPPENWSIWHDIPLDKVFGAFARIVGVDASVVAESLPVGDDFPVSWDDWESGEAEAVLLRIGWQYWNEVDRGLGEGPLDDPREVVAGIEREWAAADGLLRERGQGIEAGDGSPAESDQVEESQARLSTQELAKKHGIEQNVLRKRLDRWRYNHDTGYVEVSNAAKNEPKYLYDESAVLPVIEDIKAKSVGQKRPTNDQRKKI